MRDNRKTMDFFRPVHSTDPLVSRPVPKPGPTVIRAEKETSLPPAMKESPNAEKERNVYNLSKPPVYSSSVIVEKTVVTRKPAKKPVKSIQYEQDSEFSFEKELEESFNDDDWFDSLKEDGFFSDSSEPETAKKNEPVKLDRETKGKPLYAFTGESPFLKSVQVEKRPLSRSVPVNKKMPVFDMPTPVPAKKNAKRPNFGSVPVEKKKKKKESKAPAEHQGLPFWVTIVLTIILGIAAGIAVFILIS